MDKRVSSLAIAAFAAAIMIGCIAEDALAPAEEPVVERPTAPNSPTYQPPIAPGNRTPRAQGAFDTSGLVPEQIDAMVARAFA